MANTGDVDELIDRVDPVVDAAEAEPLPTVEAYRAAIDEIRAAAAAYYSGPDLAMDDGVVRLQPLGRRQLTRGGLIRETSPPG